MNSRITFSLIGLSFSGRLKYTVAIGPERSTINVSYAIFTSSTLNFFPVDSGLRTEQLRTVLVRRESTINNQFRSRHKRRLIAGKVKDAVGNIVRGANPPERMRLD